jgi:glycosyltransferase 2 family protein
MARTRLRWLQPLGGVIVLVAVFLHWGARPFLDGLQTLDARVLAAATACSAVSTLAVAYRWRLVARGLGVPLRLPVAVAACYRSQLLNSTLPGGVLGDVHRAVRHGLAAGDVGRGLRAVWWERTSGQVVQGLLTVLVLVAVPSPVRSASPVVAAGLAVAVVGVVALLLRSARRGGTARWARVLRSAADDVRGGVLAARAWPGVVAASAVAVAGHAATFLLAARAAGSDAPLSRLLPLALVVLVASGVPTNVAGWGPREGAAAWVFGAAGLGASTGVSAAVAYGAMALVASLPGAIVLVADRFRPPAARGVRVGRVPETLPQPALDLERVARG